ncbi:MAG: hypothetical protein GU347_02235 [Desulfurococcales archaeon]|jgi:predicted nuclease with RNAse H fold|nr:hypothetical protein [Desulfurococcales archaeon]
MSSSLERNSEARSRKLSKKAAIVGIDLSIKRASSICLYSWGAKRIIITKAYSEDEIASSALSVATKGSILVVMNSPLSEERKKRYRDLDRIASMLGCRLLPISMHPMAFLAERGIRISKLIKEALPDATIVETHPLCAAKFLGFKNTHEMVKALLGIDARGDDADAVACCLAGIFLLIGLGIEISSEDNKDIFILPTRLGSKC